MDNQQPNNQYQQPQYQQPYYQQNPQYPGQNTVYVQQQRPVNPLPTNRGLIKFILLSFITLGIYGLVVMCKMSSEINVVAQRYDGKKTMNYALMVFIFAPLTLGIAVIVWYHKFSARLGNELARRGLAYSFGAGTFWGWNVFGSLIVVGPFIYTHKMFKSMNLINGNYNAVG